MQKTLLFFNVNKSANKCIVIDFFCLTVSVGRVINKITSNVLACGMKCVINRCFIVSKDQWESSMSIQCT